MHEPKKNWFDVHEAALLSGLPEKAIHRMCSEGLLAYKPLLSKQTLTRILQVEDFMIPEVTENDYENVFNLNDAPIAESLESSAKIPNVAKKSSGYQIQITINGVCKTKYLGNINENLSPSELKAFLENERDKFKLQLLTDTQPKSENPANVKIPNVSQTGDNSYAVRIMVDGVRNIKTVFIDYKQRETFSPEQLADYLKTERNKFVTEQRLLKKSKLVKTQACA
jgi:hypothetical protein